MPTFKADEYFKAVENSLLRDRLRVAHVPSMILRRAVWLGQSFFLQAFFRHKKADESHPMILRSLLHDHVARASKATEAANKGQHPWLQSFSAGGATVLVEGADVLIAAAAGGSLEVFTSIARWVSETAQTVVPVDLARIIEVACLYGHVDIAAWLCDANNTHWVDDIRKKESLKIGITRASVVLRQKKKEALLIEMRKLPIVFEDGHETQDDTPPPVLITRMESTTEEKRQPTASPVVFTVLTNAGMMKTIGSFQESLIDAVTELMELANAPKSGLALLPHRLGSLPRMAIIKGDLVLLKWLYKASQRRNRSQKICYSFQAAMHVAAGEGRLEILQWLHTLPGTIHKCRSDTMALAARSGWADIVEWLHLNCPESGVTMSETVIDDVVRQGFMDVLRVCVQYGLGEFTARSIEVAVAAGTLEKLESLVMTECVRVAEDAGSVVYRAVRCGRVQVIEWLRTTSLTVGAESEAGGDYDELIQQCLSLQDQTTLSDIVVSSDLQAIDTSEHVTLAYRPIKTSALLDTAIKCGRVDLVRFLHERCGHTFDHHHLAIAFLSSPHQSNKIIDYILAASASTSVLLQQCAIDHFADVCDRGCPRGIELLFRAVVGVVDAVRRQEVPVDTLDQRSKSIIDMCAKLVTTDGIDPIIRCLSEDRPYLRRGVLHCGQFSSTVLEQCFRNAVATKHMRAVQVMLSELSVGQLGGDTFGLLERSGLYESLPRYSGRTASDMIRVLREAPSLDVCRKLLTVEDTFYPRGVVLEVAPPCAARVVVRCLLDGEPSERSPFVNRAATAMDLRLGVDDLLQLISQRDDDALLQFVIKHKVELIDARLWMEACSHANLDVLVFLYREAALIDTNYATSGDEAAAPWALRNALWTVASRPSAQASEEMLAPVPTRSGCRVDVVASLFRQQSSEVQARVMLMLLDSSCRMTTPHTNIPIFAKLIDTIGLDLVRVVPIQQRQRVLELALDGQRFEAATSVVELIGADAAAAATQLLVLPLMAKAARHNHLPIVPKLYALKSESEAIDVAGVRKAFGLGDASAGHTLLTELELLDAGIRDQLEQERSLFGVAVTTNAMKKPRARGRSARR